MGRSAFGVRHEAGDGYFLNTIRKLGVMAVRPVFGGQGADQTLIASGVAEGRVA